MVSSRLNRTPHMAMEGRQGNLNIAMIPIRSAYHAKPGTLDQLRTLIEVVERGSFTEARKAPASDAARDQSADPRVGAPLRARLVERVGKRAFATAAGRELIMRGRRILTDAEHALVAVRQHKEGTAGRVHIGTGPTALVYLLPPALRKLRDPHPDIELVVTTGTSHTISEGLLSNVLDIGFTALPVASKELEVVPVRTIRWWRSCPQRTMRSRKSYRLPMWQVGH